MVRLVRLNRKLRTFLLLNLLLLLLLVACIVFTTATVGSLSKSSHSARSGGPLRSLRAAFDVQSNLHLVVDPLLVLGGNTTSGTATSELPTDLELPIDGADSQISNGTRLLYMGGGDTGAPPLEVFSGGPEGTSCKVQLPLRKVALMFLTVGVIHHEQLWVEWLKQVDGILPRDTLTRPDAVCLQECKAGRCTKQCGPKAVCHPKCVAELKKALAPPTAAASPLRRQQLFNVYVHAPPAFRGFAPDSIFKQALILRRVPTAWASHSLVTAERRLMEAAFADPSNTWFVLLSETTVPLYSPTVMWRQLMSEQRSRINACSKAGDSKDRFTPRMVTANFKERHWRKSSQWFMLTRRHARMVLEDREVNLSFMRHCGKSFDRVLRRQRSCVSDEHAIPSMLAMLGEEARTTCNSDGGTYVNWAQGGYHPRSYSPATINEDVIRSMRSANCDALPAAAGANGAAFVNIRDLLPSLSQPGQAAPAAEESGTEAAALTPSTDHCMAAVAGVGGEGGQDFDLPALGSATEASEGEQCPLLARKLPAATKGVLLALYHNCTADLGVLPCQLGPAGAAA